MFDKVGCLGVWCMWGVLYPVVCCVCLCMCVCVGWLAWCMLNVFVCVCVGWMVLWGGGRSLYVYQEIKLFSKSKWIPNYNCYHSEIQPYFFIFLIARYSCNQLQCSSIAS